MQLIQKYALSLAVSVMAGVAGTTYAAGEEAATPEEAITKVRSAAKFLQDKGASGFASLNSKDCAWVWKDSYVYAFDCRMDRMVAHPMRPDLVGLPIMQITDNNGKYIFKDLCKAAAQPRGGWVEYVWTRPGAGSVSRKMTYAMTANIAFSTGIQIAAGVHDEKLTLEALTQVADKLLDPAKYPSN